MKKRTFFFGKIFFNIESLETKDPDFFVEFFSTSFFRRVFFIIDREISLLIHY